MFLKHNLRAFLWALLILILCGIPGKDLPDLSFWEALSFDKVFHLILFFILVIFMIRGFKKQKTFFFLEKYARIHAVVISILYGGLTEILQGTIFVGRKASIFDFFANVIGCLAGMFLYNSIIKFLSSIFKKRAERFDEIIFEHRFKDYGAYKLRKNYNKNMSIAISITIVLFLAFFINLMIQGFIEENKNNADELLVISEFMDMPPPEANNPPLPPIPPSSKTIDEDLLEKLKYTAPLVVQDTIDYSDTLANKKKKISLADNDSLSGSNNSNNSLSGNGIDSYTVIDEYPKYPGGDEARIKFIQEHIKYPKAALYYGINGVVNISFVVETDGSMSNIKLIRGIGMGCDEEAIRVVKLMPKWSPAKRKGQPIKSFFNLPIYFKISKNPNNL